MVSLVDIGSGLWPFAHTSVNASVGGWWNGEGAKGCCRGSHPASVVHR